MTVLEQWLLEMVKVAVGGSADAMETGGMDAAAASYAEEWRLLGQRTAILLVQARALECRHLAGELAIKYGNAAAAIIQGCWDRSHKLEAIGMMLAQQWPPLDGSEVMICRCQIDSDEVQVTPTDDPINGKTASGNAVSALFVCSHCKLPKHGKAGNGPVMVTQ